MTDLSPAANAVWDAVWNLSPVNCKSHEDRRRQQIATALRVAAAHLPSSAMYPSSDWGHGWRTGINNARQGLLVIAAELDTPSTTSENGLRGDEQ
jgi:hypothetical protein